MGALNHVHDPVQMAMLAQGNAPLAAITIINPVIQMVRKFIKPYVYSYINVIYSMRTDERSSIGLSLRIQLLVQGLQRHATQTGAGRCCR